MERALRYPTDWRLRLIDKSAIPPDAPEVNHAAAPGGSKLIVIFAYRASSEVGRSVGLLRLTSSSLGQSGWVGRSGAPDPANFAALARGGSVGRTVPTLFFFAALRLGSVGGP